MYKHYVYVDVKIGTMHLTYAHTEGLLIRQNERHYTRSTIASSERLVTRLAWRHKWTL